MPFKPKQHRPAGYEQARKAYDRQRGNSHQRGYDHKWEAFRELFLAENPLCDGPWSVCQQRGIVTPATVVDHREPHRGDMVKFWAGPFDPLCARCHNRKTRMGL